MSFLTRLFFILIDIIFLNISIALAFYINGNAPKVHIIYFVVFSNLTWLFLIALASPYSFSGYWDRPKTIKNQFIFISTHLLVVASLIFFYNREYTLIQVILVYCFFTPVFYSSKFLASFLMRRLAQPQNTKSILMISQPQMQVHARQYLVDQTDWKYNFTELSDEPATGDLIAKIKSLCDGITIDEIFVCLPYRADLNELIDFGLSKLIPIKLMADLRMEQGNSTDEKHFNQASYINVSTISIDEPVNKIIKRIFDLICSVLFILMIMSWLVPLVALLIKIDSKGPVFFIQKRNGRKNNAFSCIKFRTMLVNDDADTKQATKNDSRITKLGQLLRRTSLDELPQFINVFMGDMSMIGPRPHPIKLNEKFASQIEKLISRHYVKPGITGLAQAMGYRGETSTLADMKNRVTLDRFYIENWSFVLDLKIIYLTVVSLLKGSEKAY